MDYILAWSDHPVGQIHVTLAFIALVTGPVIFFRRKGTRSHRWIGNVYVMAMVLLNFAALSRYGLTGGPNLFHLAALGSLATILPAYFFIWRAKRTKKRGHHVVHGILMSWSYFGLVMAFIAEIVTRQFPFLLHGENGWSLFILFLATMMIAAGWWTNRQINARVPRAV